MGESYAQNWHLIEVKAFVYGAITFYQECLVFVLWQLTVELNCIFFFRCDLDKQMWFFSRSPCSAKHSYVLDSFGVQVYKMKLLLMQCPQSMSIEQAHDLEPVCVWCDLVTCVSSILPNVSGGLFQPSPTLHRIYDGSIQWMDVWHWI